MTAERRRPCARQQRGVTLISLMVGMVISLLGLVAMLSLYKNLIRQSIISAQRASSDGQISAGLLAEQIDLQGAGYGIGSGSAGAASGTDFVVLSGASLNDDGQLSGTLQTLASGGSAIGNAVVWGSKDDLTTYSCQAALAVDGGLLMLKGSDCNSAASWSSVSWTQSAQLVADDMLGDQSSSFTASVGTCSPFGKAGTTATAVIVRLTAVSAVSGLSSSATLCLSNLPS
ncbi:prepilin-type N-terminal cleavage/methylation domain-containing protein [Solimonas marina]|uniref:Uncharacterized protein n=1 Tax=Solimonas marina TaxID=2714601 RepID=A0A970B549_9GAMM|nr:prepilin-type N-terminal cleavage/methylation domain-containing protein [Solimonas marina]NKF21170.1 hypothetical protein [Solimonas marina]